ATRARAALRSQVLRRLDGAAKSRPDPHHGDGEGAAVRPGWPSGSASSELVDVLLAMLDERIDQTPEGDEKGRLHRARDAIAGLTREVAVELFAAYAAKVTTGE